MQTGILVIHYLVCALLVLVILLQSGKGAEIGAVFSGSSQTIFGGRGPATFFQKLTVGLALVFLCTSIGLAYYAKVATQRTVIEEAPAPEQPAESGR
ncbi:MAG: preprotein translocase subunit SecG [Deltaproteobacteria bacterium]|nr:preprotein translocase subunit SecG [Deltaproteobacteria bacterium]